MNDIWSLSFDDGRLDTLILSVPSGTDIVRDPSAEVAYVFNVAAGCYVWHAGTVDTTRGERVEHLNFAALVTA